ncbi:MAG: hypothetical protein LBH91_08225 [Prevotellaceae bacterium]|jgi:hypothetical protein|nr:hypothetical protein [Prevotellaceae bacterium]
MKIIGRYNEQQALKQYVESDKPEFVAVYGRRRVGKIFLIKEYFNNSFSFYISGLANASKVTRRMAIESFTLVKCEAFFWHKKIVLDRKNMIESYMIFGGIPFYLNFIKNAKQGSEHFWTNLIDNAKHRTWSGYAFEQVCMQHTAQIRKKLGIPGVITYLAAWRSKKSKPAVQVDLLIDRNDGIINLCEMKYANSEFVIDKKQDEKLRNKKSAFTDDTKTLKAVHVIVVTTYGMKRNEYWSNIQSEVMMNNSLKQ